MKPPVEPQVRLPVVPPVKADVAPRGALRPYALRTLLAAAALLGGLAQAGCGAPAGALDVSAYPPEQQANYSVFENRCTRCHDLVRPLAARIGQGGWEAYVSRMARHPGAGIGHADQRAIAAFLEFHHSRPGIETEEGTP